MAGQDAYEALQRTARTVGARQGVLVEPEPKRGAVTDGYVAAPVPSLAVPLLAGAAGEVVDSSSLRFLTAAALRQREEERKKELEEKRKRELEEAEVERMLELNRRVSADLPLTRAETEAWRRWIFVPPRPRLRKKRKKKLPRTSSHSSYGRARRRQQRWHARYAGFAGCGAPRDVPHMVVTRPVWTRRTVLSSWL